MLQRILLALAAWAALGATAAGARETPDSLASREPALAAALPVDASPRTDASPAPARAARWAALEARGLHLSGSASALWIGDVAGGARRGGVTQSLAFAALDADLARATGWWRGGRAFANAAWIRGGDLSGRFVGDALVASNLQAYGSLRLYDAWLEQSLAGGAWTVRAGSMAADEEFTGTVAGTMFTNSGFGWQPGIGANVVNGGPIYFVPGLGLRLAASGGESWALRAGAWDGDSFDSPDGDPAVNAHGLRIDLRRSQGAFVIAEGEHRWAAERAPGTAKLGAWRHTADFPDLRRDAAGTPVATSGLEPAVHHGNAGAYGSLEQRLWRPGTGEDRGVTAWTRAALAPADRSRFSRVGEAGLRWDGPFASRPADAVALGVVSAWVSPELAAAVRDANALGGGSMPVPDAERVVEAAWMVRLGGHLLVTPDVQWIFHPGAAPATPDATVLGLRVSWQ